MITNIKGVGNVEHDFPLTEKDKKWIVLAFKRLKVKKKYMDNDFT